jgi:prevent-host-death family protein
VSTQVNVYEAKTRLSQLLDQATAGEDIVIARNGRPVARLVPVQRAPHGRRPGSLKGKIHLAPDHGDVEGQIADMFYGQHGPDAR